jgi:hypothetical protein
MKVKFVMLYVFILHLVSTSQLGYAVHSSIANAASDSFGPLATVTLNIPDTTLSTPSWKRILPARAELEMRHFLFIFNSMYLYTAQQVIEMHVNTGYVTPLAWSCMWFQR